MRVRQCRPLKFGRSQAPESEKVTAPTMTDINETAAYASLKLQTMIYVQLYTGMRPSEVVSMTRSSIDSSSAVWIYRPDEHKNEHWGHQRIVPLGPKAQKWLRAWMRAHPGEVLFEGRDCRRRKREYVEVPTPEERSHAQRRLEIRRFLIQEPNMANRDIAKLCQVSRNLVIAMRRELEIDPPRDAPSTGKPMLPRSYWQSIDRIQQQHKLRHWTPNQLRHAFATRTARTHGTYAAQILMDHTSSRTTDIYIDPDITRRLELAAEIG